MATATLVFGGTTLAADHPANPIYKGPNYVAPAKPTPTPRRKVTFIADNNSKFTVPYAPTDLTMDNVTPVMTTIERPGKEELVLMERLQQPKVNFTIRVAAEYLTLQPNTSMEAWITQLRVQLAKNRRWRISYGANLYTHWWRFTDASITVVKRTTTNDIEVADVDLTLIRASDIGITTTPAGGNPPKAPATPPASTGYIEYTIKSAKDTLWALAVTYLKNGARWTEIAKLSGITDPTKLKIGQKVRIPKK